MTESDDWLDEERKRHGPVTPEQVHAAYDMLLDAWVAARRAETNKSIAED